MNNLVFLDTETTGNDLLTDRLFQICYSFNKKIYCEYFLPPIPISIKAQSITHVTNKMIAGSKPFSESKMRQDLQNLLLENIMVAHNAAFDLCMLAHEGVTVNKFICTLKIVRYLDEEGIIPEYNMQYLRYYHDLTIDAIAHSAEGDVLVLEAIFQKIYNQMLQVYKNHYQVIDKMIEISSQPSLLKIFPFGKYRGRKISEIAKLDRKYTEWILNEKIQNNPDDEDWIFSLKHFLEIKN